MKKFILFVLLMWLLTGCSTALFPGQMNELGSLQHGIALGGQPVIAPETASNLSQVAQMGKGVGKCVAWSEDGKAIILISSSGAFTYAADTLKLEKYVPAAAVGECLATAAHGRYFSTYRTAGQEYAIDVWDARWGQLKQTIKFDGTHSLGRRDILFSPTGRWITVYQYDSKNPVIEMWAASTGKLAHSFPAASAGKAAFSANERFFALTGAGNESLEVWDIQAFKLVHTLPLRAQNFIISPDGKWLLALVMETIQVWDVSQEVMVQQTPIIPWQAVLPETVPEFVNSQLWLSLLGEAQSSFGMDVSHHLIEVAFSPDHQRVAILPRNERLEIRDVATQATIGYIEGHTLVNDLAFHPGEPLLAVGWQDNNIWLVDVVEGQTVVLKGGPEESKNVVAFSPQGDLLASSNITGLVHFWDIQTSTEEFSLQSDQYLTSLSFNVDGNRLATANGGFTQMWNLDSKTALERCECSETFFLIEGLHKGYVAEGGRYGVVLMKATVSEGVLTNTPGHALWNESPPSEDVWESSFRSLAYSSVGQLLVAGFKEKVRLWNVEEEARHWGSAATPLYEFDLPGSAVDVGFSPDGKIVAAANGQDGVYLWEVATGKLLGIVSMDQAAFLAFNSDGRVLAVGSAEGVIRLYQVRK